MVVREVLDEHGCRGYPKTSGSRGIHVNVRIEPRWDFLEVRRAALALAREVERRVPDLATSKWWKEERHGVFVDYNQNARDRTVASGVLGAPDAGRARLVPARVGRGARRRARRPARWTRCPTGWRRSATRRRASTTTPARSTRCTSWPTATRPTAWATRRGRRTSRKQKGEPKRVQPSRDTDRPSHRGRAGDPQPGGPPPAISTGGLQRGFGSKPRTGQGHEHEFDE